MRGFTLIETLVAISLLSIAIVAPMSLTSQSLSAAYYARDQITAFNLAQEGLEAVRAIRDGQILEISRTADASSIDLFGPIPVNQNFTIDSRSSDPAQAMHICPSNGCPPLQTDGVLYGYDVDTETWPLTNFTRTLRASYVGASQDEIRLSVRVEWPTAARQIRSFTIYENLYRWVNDGSASTL
jgi:prepilin-type N-terminal cleavage/methylation domain-containing protein